MVQVPAPVLSISATGQKNVSVGFDTISSWNYILQGAASLSGGVAWSNLTTVLAQGTNGHAVFVDGVTNQQRFYRLSLSR